MSMTLREALTRRGRVPDRVLLDYLELAEHLGEASTVTTAELMEMWNCTQPWACRRMAALQRYQLLDAATRTGPGAHWVIKRLGPVV
jgi:hypothetical protein